MRISIVPEVSKHDPLVVHSFAGLREVASGESPGEERARGTGIHKEFMARLRIWQEKNIGVMADCHWDGHLFIEVVVGRPGCLLLSTFYTTVDVLC